MNDRGTVGSFIERHCAKATRSGRRILLPQTGHCLSQARKTGKLAVSGQIVKLHQEFQTRIHKSHELGAVLGRADNILASVETTANLSAMKLKGWTDAETQTFTTVRGTFPASSEVKESSQSDAKKATGVKATDAADAYEHILTIQNATDPANAPARAEFKLDIFPPDHHVPPATRTDAINTTFKIRL